ncbi:MAG TPA: xanthine dehydrogenase family protein subunit M [Xanthobacteraceae bacterium]|nr:xanthine dehydrogenase family protein subunit M [Xanthobacteraceae bacterium]
MKPPVFSYHDPRTPSEAVGLLATLDNAKLLAGGQSLMPMLNMRFVLPDHVIDLNRVDGLSYIRENKGALDIGAIEIGAIEIGAMTRQRDIEFSEVVRTRCPLMHEAIAQVGHRQTRNRGTLGGSLCHLDPAAELVAVAATLDATVTVAGKGGTRSVAFADFPIAYMTPAVNPDELVVGVSFPCWRQPHGYAFVEFSRRHGDFAIVSAAALIEEDDVGKVTRAALTLGGMGPAPLRAAEVERALIGETIEEKRLRDICEALRKLEAMEDIHAPASYRQQLAAVLSRRALMKAHERLTTARARA